MENAAKLPTPLASKLATALKAIGTTGTESSRSSMRPRSIEAVVTPEPEAPKVMEKLDWEIIAVKNSLPRIRILNNDIRQYMYHCMNVNIVQGQHLSNRHDSQHHKDLRTEMAVYEFAAFFSNLEDFTNLDETDFSEGGYCKYEVFKPFVDMLKGMFEEHVTKATEAFKVGQVTFEELACFLSFHKGLVGTIKFGSIIGSRLISAAIKQSFFTGPYIELKCSMYVNLGKGLKLTRITQEIPAFEGRLPLSEIGFYDMESDTKTMEYLVKRGQAYIDLTTNVSYKAYSGEVVRRSYWRTYREKATGRIMVDVMAMRNIDSNYDQYHGFDRNNDRDDDDGSDKDISVKLTDEVLACTSPFVYGFSFVAKQWGEFMVDNIAKIEFRNDAFDKLVLDEDTKDIVFSLVETEFTTNSDLIDGKGGGCIFLLEGPPGVGKTLTAEAVAEKLERPLYMVGVGELGTDVSALEDTLKRILDVASTWNAVLLIDEADIFLEERSDHNIERNAMVGVFLRMLEYYPGILFLTTNRAANLDQAFYSRISMAIHYSGLSKGTRVSIWKNLLSSYKVTLPDDYINELANHHLNGRQIKNAIRNACALAKKAKREPELADFERVINKVVEFELSMSYSKGGKIKSFFRPVWNKVVHFFNS